jgi:catechol 2,3-dioxygenase-like lactoylglutathione lyase family enzyme
MDRAKRFYENTLGFKIADEDEGGVTFASADTEFYVYATGTAGTAENTAACWVVPDLDSAMADLRSRGVTFEEYDFPELKTVNGVAEPGGGVRAAWFKDSEGNTLGLAQRG